MLVLVTLGPLYGRTCANEVLTIVASPSSGSEYDGAAKMRTSPISMAIQIIDRGCLARLTAVRGRFQRGSTLTKSREDACRYRFGLM